MRVPAPFGTLRDLLSLERIALDTFWGGVFGGSVGLAVYDVWRGRRSAARRKLLAVGSVSIAFQTLNLAYRLWTSFAPYLGWRAFRSLGGLVFIQDEIVTNTYFQAALLILAAGLLMPRDLRDTVQVTENLWL
jgi:hypothetical protein